MAIASLDMSCDKVSKCSGSVPSSKDSCRFLKFDCPTQSSVSSTTSKCSKTKKNNRSPYLPGDRVQLFSRLTEKRFIHNNNIVSSFPLAMELYKTNSDDLKPPKKNNTKKVKKSVLTLPNKPTPVPHACTVSDINDSEYFDKNEDQKRKVVKKRSKIPNNRKGRLREKDFEFYDRDAQYCSQLNLDMDFSSTDMMKNFNGDGRRVSNKRKVIPSSNKIQTASNNLNDVWAVLRNVNRYQFRPSPPMSEESIVPVKKKLTKRSNRKESRVIETCRTQEFAYISSYELDKKASADSPSSSTDRITVIDNQDDFSKTCEEFEKRLLLTHDFLAKNIIQKNINLCKSPRNNVRALGKTGTKDNNKQLTTTKKNKRKNWSPQVFQDSKSVSTNIGSGNKDSLVGITLQPNDNSEIMSFKTGDEYFGPKKDSFIGSDNSRSSKAELPNRMNEQVNKNDNALLNKDRESTATTTTISPNGLDSQPKKVRLVTTMPSSCVMPKLTETEIKRRLSLMKFPIVILGKDQVSSSFKVVDYEPPQFNGLDDHIWPFMLNWSTTPTVPEDTKHNTQSRNCQPYLLDSTSASDIKNKSRKLNTDFGTYKQKATTWKDKKEANNDLTTNKFKTKIRSTPESEIDKSLQCIKKQKSIVQLKDKMLNFLYKKASNLYDNNESYVNEGIKPIIICDDNSGKVDSKVSVAIDSELIPDKVLVQKNLPEKKPLSAEGRNKKTPICKYSWAKAKWASDFIENVMKKVRNGVYYTQDRHAHQTDLKEVSVQAGSLFDSTDSTQTSCSESDLMYDETNKPSRNDIIRIPGFDDMLPRLEIKTLNMKQIAVKHCVTNSMLQFDVSVPVKGDQNIRSLSKTLSLTPIEITESQTVVYKCKTTILNAMLPAELCSILPKMISSIIDSNIANITSSVGNCALCPTKTSSWLSTIAELTRHENGDVTSITAFKFSPEIKEILEGRFANVEHIKPTFNNIDFKMKYDQCMIAELLQTVPVDSLNNLLKYQKSPLIMELNNSQSEASLHQTNDQHPDITDIQNHAPICTALDIYTTKSDKLASAIKPYNFMDFIEIMMRSYNLQINQNLSNYFDMFKFQYDGKNIEIDIISLTNEIGVQNKISVTVSNVNIDSLFKGFSKIRNNKEHEMNSTCLECIDYVNTSLTRKSHIEERTQVALKKIKRKGFCKLYRKCNSKPCISSKERCTSSANISLNKITTIDDFFQMLGSKKIFSSVFDGTAVKKILSSVVEMKNWISEINPKQALLILLLANKKDTQNLVRFRPIILQGIAVNRITKASELDMEIEVIERENFNKLSQVTDKCVAQIAQNTSFDLSCLEEEPKPITQLFFLKQCDGLTNLPETVTDYENLLDELYWIAKTTASDYNKPFNESSERLLKSLLQKRKKLNPSYLRVMARYVGLGLVKTQTEC